MDELENKLNDMNNQIINFEREFHRKLLGPPLINHQTLKIKFRRK